MPTNAFETETEDVTEYVREFDEVTALSTVFGHRKLFRDSVSDGRGVLEMPTRSGSQGAAKAEVRALAAEHGAAFVPLHEVFTVAAQEYPVAELAPDGVHPTPRGSALIADAWRTAASISDSR